MTYWEIVRLLQRAMRTKGQVQMAVSVGFFVHFVAVAAYHRKLVGDGVLKKAQVQMVYLMIFCTPFLLEEVVVLVAVAMLCCPQLRVAENLKMDGVALHNHRGHDGIVDLRMDELLMASAFHFSVFYGCAAQ